MAIIVLRQMLGSWDRLSFLSGFHVVWEPRRGKARRDKSLLLRIPGLVKASIPVCSSPCS